LTISKYALRVSKKPTAEAVRDFSRFFTERMGSLSERHEGLGLTLTQSRLLITIRENGPVEVSELAERLHLDLTFVSRTLTALEDRRLVKRKISTRDKRARSVELLANGRRLINKVEQRSNQRVLEMTAHLSQDEITSMLDAMNTIRVLLDRSGERKPQ